MTAWREISDAAQDHGIAVSDVDTPRTFAGVLSGRAVVTTRERDALADLLDAVEHVRFANPERSGAAPGGAALATSTELLTAAIRRNSTRADRIRATCAPASVISPSRAKFTAERA